jgi:hypothetical protein
MSKNALIAGIAACAVVFVFALYKLLQCDQACQIGRVREAERQRRASEPPPPPPLPFGTNTTADCKGIVEERFEWPGQFRKFPTDAPRSNWMGDQHTNPCAVYFQILEGVMGFGTDYGMGVNGWEERPGRSQWPVRIDLVAGAGNARAKWKYITCREWHPVMKEWRCR